VLGINDQPVTIRQIEKMIIEKGFTEGWVKPRLPQKRRVESVAVIGSGPAGLAAADRLNQKGYRVAVFEKELSPGGLLLYGIPNFKLDKRIVERRIKLMKEEGIIFECGVTVGLDISYNYLKKRFSALIMAGGTQQPRDIDIPGRHLSGIFFAADYLRDQNKEIIGELHNSDQKISATAKNVVVIGGGDTGSDCMGTALRQGAGQVYQVEIMPRLPEGRAQNNPWPLWPLIDRISSSHQEGGVRHWSVRPLRFEGDDNGMVKRLHCIEVEWVSKDGQYIPVDKVGTDFSIEADLVLLAMGFLGPGPDPLADVLELQRDSRGNILVDSNHMTSSSGIFSAGDMARGQSLVVQAMADGKAAADDVDLYISSNRNA
jgi:glutamate synthase (NADPH/NADH) small chain